MRSRRESKNRLILFAMACMAASPLTAGVVYEIDVTDHSTSPPSAESIQTAVEGRNLKMGIASGGRGSRGEMIYRGDRREMVVIDHENRTYYLMDEKAIRQLAEQMNEAASHMQEALKNVPEDKRAMIEQMMKERMPTANMPIDRPKIELKKTGARGDKNGYPCVKYEVLRGGKKIRELWVTDWANVEGGSDVVDAFEDMADFFRAMMDAVPNMAGGREGPAIDDNAFQHMKELGGFPVVTRDLDENGLLEGETTLRSAKRQTIDPDAFGPPSGYKQQEMFRGR